MAANEYHPEKLRELIVYVAHKSVGDRNFGMTKLNKILFFADFTAYQRNGRSITGAVYQHLDQGPCPQQLVPALADLKRGALKEVKESTYVGVRRRLIPTRSADTSLFAGDEIALIDEIIDILAPMTNTEVSELSHRTMAWRLTEDRQEVPYGTALIDHSLPSDADVKWLKGVARGGAMARAAG